MESSVVRVLGLFSLTLPPISLMAMFYAGLGEHVFGLSYVVGKRLRPRLKRLLRVTYLLSSALVAVALFTGILLTCGGTASACPPVRLGERACLAFASSGALASLVILPLDRCASPLLNLGHPTGFVARCAQASTIVLLWLCIARKQTVALLILALLAARRALVPFPWVNRAVGRVVKLITVVHMSRVLGHQCEDGVPKLAVAAVIAMIPL